MNDPISILSGLADEDYCYLTTTGRVTGQPREIEIWFGLRGSTLYLLAGNPGSDWVRNLRKTPEATVRISQHTFRVAARIVAEHEEDALARSLVAKKYNELEAGGLSHWAQTALPVALDVQGPA